MYAHRINYFFCMKRFIMLLLLLLAGLEVKAQLEYEDYYSDQDLKSILLQARTPAEQIDAYGMLAIHYQGIHQDSLADLYFNKISKIPVQVHHINLTARILWWDMRYSANEEKSYKYLQFAEDHNLEMDKMVAHLFLSEDFIHSDLTQAEKHVLIAKDILECWESDTLAKDSIRLKFYSTAAHIYVHKQDGIPLIHYLLLTQDYVEQDKRESLKVSAISHLADIYSEWAGQPKKAIVWANKLYDHYLNTHQPNKRLVAAFSLAFLYSNLGDTAMAISYFREIDNLRDSLHAYGFYQNFIANKKLQIGLLSTPQMIQLLDNHFNQHLFLHSDWTIMAKAGIYFQVRQWDSLGLYLSKLKAIKTNLTFKDNQEYNFILAQYHLRNKEYDNAIVSLKELLQQGRKEGNLSTMLSALYFLSTANGDKKDYKQANEYLWDYVYYKDSLNQMKNKDEVASLEIEKLLAFQENAHHTKQVQQEAEQARITLRNKYWVLGLLTGLLVLLVIAGLLWHNYRVKLRSELAIKKAYQELKVTQAQLIQSEKMASLGELTAGIAHEIQNPLNFVNNFSEVNKELLAEM